MKGFLLRVKNILVRPQQEWKVIQEERTTYGQLIGEYVAVIAAVPPLSALAERLVFGRGIAGSSPLGQVLALNVLWYFMIIINMVITSAVITAVAFSKEPWWFNLRGLQLASFSFTPLFLAGIPAIVPRLNWVFYPAIVYSTYLLYLGIRTMTGSGQGKAVARAAASFFAAVLIIGTLSGLEYVLESFLVAKVQ
jgi:hypothetical protein